MFTVANFQVAMADLAVKLGDDWWNRSVNIGAMSGSMMTANIENSAITEDTFFSYLPEKLRCHLLPFQRDGIAFGIRRNGRCVRTI